MEFCIGVVAGKEYVAYPRLISSQKGALSGEERKTRLRVCIFDGEAVKSAFALLLTKVTKPSQGNLLFRAVSGTHYG